MTNRANNAVFEWGHNNIGRARRVGAPLIIDFPLSIQRITRFAIATTGAVFRGFALVFLALAVRLKLIECVRNKVDSCALACRLLIPRQRAENDLRVKCLAWGVKR